MSCIAGNTTGKIVLTGGWSLLPPGSDVPLLTREVHLRDTTDPSDYANQVTAMSRLSGLPADEIAHV
jgi:ABC-type transport auxiliary lipoprotein component